MSTGRALLATLAWTALAGMTAPDATGQSREPGAEAEAALRAFWDAYAARDYDAAVSFIDPDAVRRIYEFQLTNARLAEQRRVREAAREKPPEPRYPPDMPPEVVAWFEQERARDRERARENRPEVVFPEFLPLAELEQMSPAVFAARELRLLDPKANPGAALPQYSWITVDVWHALRHQGAERTLVGSVVASNTLVHLLYSLHAPGKAEPWTMQTASMLLTPDGWKIWRGAEDLIGSLGSGIGESLAESAFTGPPGYDAQEVVRELFTAIDEKRWADAAALVDPETLDRFKVHHVRQHQQRKTAESTGPRYAPDTPPEVVAWYEQQRAAAPRWDPEEQLSRELAGVRTLKELDALSPVEVFGRHLQAADPREQAHRAAADHGISVPADIAARTDRLMNPGRTVIGHVVENDSLVQVVYRANWAPQPMDRLAVVASVRRTPAGWRLWHAPEDPSLFMTAGWFGMQVLASDVIFFADQEAELRSAADLVAEWTLPDGARARAFLTGYTGGIEPPEAMTIEITRADGTVTKTDVPAAVFPKLMQMIAGWHDPEPEQ